MALQRKSDGSGYTWSSNALAPMPASARTQAGAFYAVHVDGWHICPRCTVQAVPDGQPFCQPCVAELRRIVRVTRAGGDAYENESESE